MDSIKSAISKLFTVEVIIFTAAIGFMAAMHSFAFDDRMVLIQYYLTAVGSAYALFNRRAIGLASVVIAVLAATMFAQIYYSAAPDHWSPIYGATRDMIGLGALLYLTAGLLMASYRVQRDEKRRFLQSKIEEQLVTMRAEALRHTSHEVRTPLSTITAISETLLDGSTGDLSCAQREFIEDIDEAAQHLLALVNDILDYAKAEAGMIRLAPQPVALSELVSQCVTMVTPRAKEAGVNVTTQVDSKLTEVIADPLRLRQILLNLLSNAIKYNSDGGNVIVRIRPEDDQQFRVSVRDTGRGIAPEHLKHLFEPYYQAAIADQGIGTGLGLAIIKHLTQLHGGTIDVESVVETGTIFTVKLPLETLAGDEPEPTLPTTATKIEVPNVELMGV